MEFEVLIGLGILSILAFGYRRNIINLTKVDKLNMKGKVVLSLLGVFVRH